MLGACPKINSVFITMPIGALETQNVVKDFWPMKIISIENPTYIILYYILNTIGGIEDIYTYIDQYRRN